MNTQGSMSEPFLNYEGKGLMTEVVSAPTHFPTSEGHPTVNLYLELGLITVILIKLTFKLTKHIPINKEFVRQL